MHPVKDIKVKWVADCPLWGYEETQFICFAIAGFVGTHLGLWLASCLANM